ncbi:hypothetical protein BASA50_007048 [Batrachochytrium salamandrivorans]|uniref:Uncharacterized protein n=1 Tax=Batrachochytrium salamandrivorans TaxID=1357716 RepID=A0ABQ8F7Z4_9FUNG|nr:hypothetical protein BASA62_001688 [Batrachochytrium salamandrivorans]KAH6593822.1 hypothetical protein BASA50_007048 [Batrachochytrium salamandrivorans]KAH9272352.1 hypothetical protein BASA83_005445 [Batrachochytrium salamandrivorans]
MEDSIRAILEAFGLLSEFMSSQEYPQSIWSIEIGPTEGSTAFSRPLVISREGNIVRLAHYVMSTYDIEYDPLMEFAVGIDGCWVPISVFRHWSGLKFINKDIPVDEATALATQWATSLLENGYNNPDLACVSRKSDLPIAKL